MDKIGKYEIREEIGRGGMGVVYKAYDSVMEREVAIKVISDIALEIPEIKTRFYREARTAGKLSHENITIVHDVGELDGRPYIVMEYLTGCDLRSLLDRHEPLTLGVKLDYAIQICRGLAYSHSKDIIHRDIKPANIRVLGDKKVKIMDFGIARPGASNLTNTGAMIGTPFYMSPEQIQGKKVDKRSDIFSFGVLFYELLTNHKPFSGEEPTAVMYKIVHEQPEHLEALQALNLPRLNDVIARTLEKDPERRYQAFDEVAEDLGLILDELRGDERKKLAEQRRRISKLLSEIPSLLGKRKFRDAMQVAEKAASIDPANTEASRALEQIRQAEAKERIRVQVEDRLATAKKLCSGEQFSAAIGVIESVFTLEPDQREARQLLKSAREGLASKLTADAKLLITRNDFDGAERIAAELRALQPNHPALASLASAIAMRKAELQRLQSQPTVVQPSPPPNRQTVTLPPDAREAETRVAAPPHEPDRAPLRREEPARPAARRGTSRVFKIPYAIAAGIVLVILVGVVYRLFFSAAAQPEGFVALNVLPWAEVTRITSHAGGEVPLEQKVMTPCRLTLPEGTYDLRLSNPGFPDQLVVTVVVRRGEVQEVLKTMPGFNFQKAVSAF